jgi:hypothetical protein
MMDMTLAETTMQAALAVVILFVAFGVKSYLGRHFQ